MLKVTFIVLDFIVELLIIRNKARDAKRAIFFGKSLN